MVISPARHRRCGHLRWPHSARQPRATRSFSPHDHPCRLTRQNRHLRARFERLCLLLRSGRCRHGPSRTPTPTVLAVPLLQPSVAVMLLRRTLLRLRMPQKRHLWKRCSGLMSQRQHVPSTGVFYGHAWVFFSAVVVCSLACSVQTSLAAQKTACGSLDLRLIGAVLCAGPTTSIGTDLHARSGALCGRPWVFLGVFF